VATHCAAVHLQPSPLPLELENGNLLTPTTGNVHDFVFLRLFCCFWVRSPYGVNRRMDRWG